jgi:transposase
MAAGPIADRQGLPVAVHLESATPHEVTLVHATLAERFVKELPVRLIGDNAYAYESDRLDADLAHRGVKLIAPHRRTRTHRTQDGHTLRRYRRRWNIERLFAWFQNFRRIVLRISHSSAERARFEKRVIAGRRVEPRLRRHPYVIPE